MVRAYWGHSVGRRTSKTVIFSASLYILQAFKFLTLSILFSLEDGYWFRLLISAFCSRTTNSINLGQFRKVKGTYGIKTKHTEFRIIIIGTRCLPYLPIKS
jgi:hypothetical protein